MASHLYEAPPAAQRSAGSYAACLRRAALRD
jgi:hypothetical protein